MSAKTLSQIYVCFAAWVKTFAAQNRMLVRSDISASAPFALGVQLFWSVICFGFLLGAMPLARQYPLYGVLMGAVATACLFFLTRSINGIANALFRKIEQPGFIRYPAGILLILVYLAAYLTAPAAVLWVAAKLAPAFMQVVRPMDAYFVLVGDFLLGSLTGIRLFLPAPDEQKAAGDGAAKQ